MIIIAAHPLKRRLVSTGSINDKMLPAKLNDISRIAVENY